MEVVIEDSSTGFDMGEYGGFLIEYIILTLYGMIWLETLGVVIEVLSHWFQSSVILDPD